MLRSAIYARLSLDRTGEGVSVERQLADCRALAARHEWAVVAEYRDDSKSAWRRDRCRPGWDSLLEAIKNDELDAVVVWHGDRLVRQPYDLEELIALVEEKGLMVAAPAGTRDLGNPDDRFILRIETAAACRESDSTSRRVRRVKEEQARQGRRHGSTPFGWRSEDEAGTVRRVIQSLLAGDSLRTVKQDLNTAGVLAPRGGAWTETQIRQIALRWSNAGKRTHRGEIVSDGQWPALVTTEQQERVIRLLKDPMRRTNAGTAQSHLLTGIARCGICSSKLRHHWADGKARTKPVYRCENLHLTCSARPLEEFVLEVVERRLNMPDAEGLAAGRADDQLQNRLLNLRSRKEDLAEEFADGGIDRQQLRSGTERLNAQIEEVEESLREQDRRRVASETDAADVRSLSLDRQRALIRALMIVTVDKAKVKGHTFDPTRIRIDWIGGQG